MNATKELRKLLDQRDVSWRPSAWSPQYETYYQTDNGVGVVASEINGKITVRFESRITPEQAVEATVGRETCKISYERKCSECGAYISDNASMYRMSVGDGCFTVKSRRPNFCPNCGRNVVQP